MTGSSCQQMASWHCAGLMQLLASMARCFWDVGHSLSAPHRFRPTRLLYALSVSTWPRHAKDNIRNDIAMFWWEGENVRGDPCSGRPTRCVFSPYFPLKLATNQIAGVFFAFRQPLALRHLPRMQKRAGGGLFFAFRRPLATTISLACKSEPIVRFFSVSAPSLHHHLPRMQKRADRTFFFTFRRPLSTTTSLACKSEPEVGFFDLLVPSYHHHLPRTQKRAGGGSFFTFRRPLATTTSLARKSEPEVVLFSRFDRILPLKTPPPTATSSPMPTTTRTPNGHPRSPTTASLYPHRRRLGSTTWRIVG